MRTDAGSGAGSLGPEFEHRVARRVVVRGAVTLCAVGLGGTRSESAGPSSAAPGGEPLGPADKVPVGGGAVYAEQKVVVAQPKAGEYKAFNAICTHQRCLVANVEGGTINCGCHGSRFSINDGAVVQGPALLPLAAKAVSSNGGTLTLT
jgi:Rieske Fe-S protein